MNTGSSAWGYRAGFVVAVLLIALGLAVWLPDPLRVGNVYWIELLDAVVYLLAVPPLLWLISAALGLRGLRRARRPSSYSVRPQLRGYRTLLVIRVLTVAASAAAIALLPLALDRPVQAAVAYGAALVLALTDTVAADVLARRSRRRAIARICIWLGVLALLLCPTSYMVTYPGLTMNMNRLVHAEGGSKQAGSLTGVLVFERPAFPIDWIYARLFPHYSFARIEKLGMSLGEYDMLMRTMKADANTLAGAVALGKLGIGEGVRRLGAEVSAVLRDGPAAGTLKPGDIITAAESSAVKTVADLTAAMRGVSPGAQVKLSVLRDGASVRLTVGTQPHPDDSSRAAFGIQVSDAYEPDVPLHMDYRNFLLHEGGPSHGAMLALAILDQLTPGGVTHGNRVAGTGTIEPDGSVGRIGGVEQKAYTIGRTDADVFFVPAGQELDARKGSVELNIVPVQTLDEMLQWLAEHPRTVAG